MRTLNKRFKTIGLLSVSTALAAVIVVASTADSQAQFRPSSMSMGPRGGMGGGGMSLGGSSVMGGSNFRSEPRFQRFQNSTYDNGVTRGKGKGKPVVVVTDPGRGDGRPGRYPPGKRPRGPIIVPVIGTGVAVVDPGPAGAGPRQPSGGGVALTPRGGGGGLYLPPPNEPRYVKDEVLLEFAGQVSRDESGAAARRNRLTRIESLYLPLTNTTMFRWKITDGRSVPTVLNSLGRERGIIFRQPNFIYSTSQGAETTEVKAEATPDARPDTQPAPSAGMTLQAAPEAADPKPAAAAAAALPQAAGDPAQYALRKLRLGEAHNLANGDKVLVAVIDSGVDLGHPELKGAVAGSFDALEKPEKPHAHGTAIAGAIVAHARLMGAAPAARILAIRAFGTTGVGSDATTMAIIKGLKYATDQKALVINMSFAGPTDPGLGRHLAAAKANGAVLIAAAGNFGPKSGPQYPAADPSVIAVSATDANDQIFKASNIGPHVAVTAPGVDILLPAPNNDYQLTSGTSFSAAYVSGVAALILQRAPGLKPDGVRKILEQTAKDLGPTGKDPEYGAGLVDAYQAILAVQSPAASATGQGGPQPKMTAQ
jgi:subtilisin family serine protease